MATYPTLSPTLSALAATELDPTGAESADKLNDAIVQTRVWLGDFLGQIFTDTGVLKPYAIDGTVIPAGTIRGSNPVGDVQREILQRSVRAIDITLLAITAAEIADLTITGAKIAPATITADKLVVGAFSAASLATASVTGDKIAGAAIDTGHLRDLIVTTGKIANLHVTGEKIAERAAAGSKLPVGTAGMILVGGNTVGGVAECFAPKTMSGAATINADGVVSLLPSGEASAFAIVGEVAASGTNGGSSTAVTWHTRGASPANPWSKITDLSDMLNINGSKIEFKQDGTYRVTISCPAYSAGGHKTRITVKKDANSSDTEDFIGTAEYSHTTDATQTRSVVDCIIVTSGATSTLRPYLEVFHYTVNTQANTGLGRAVSTAGPTSNEIYASVTVFRLL
jgi:hypothetical protein